MKVMHVKAAPGIKFTKQGEVRSYIGEETPIEVEASHYYRRAVADGDLVELTEKEWKDHLAARDVQDAAALTAAAAKGGNESAKKKDAPK